MPYVIINGGSTHYNEEVMPFTTQHGKRAVKFIGDELPSTKRGFKYYNDNDEEIADLSAYKFEYSQNEYSVEQDNIESPQGNNEPLPQNSFSMLVSNINQINARVNELTPYTDEKMAYIGDTECEFDLGRTGNVSAWITTDGVQTPCTFEVVGDKIKVYFDELEQTATVNISIQ